MHEASIDICCGPPIATTLDGVEKSAAAAEGNRCSVQEPFLCEHHLRENVDYKALVKTPLDTLLFSSLRFPFLRTSRYNLLKFLSSRNCSVFLNLIDRDNLISGIKAADAKVA